MLESEDPHQLPVGWSVELKDVGGRDLPFVGINCAACHSGELRYQGKAVRIDGAPNLYQLEAFFLDLDSAITDRLTNRLHALLMLLCVPPPPPKSVEGAEARAPELIGCTERGLDVSA